MKNYEKPRMNIFALCGTDALCACAIDAVGDNMDGTVKQMLENFYGEQIKDDTFTKKLFNNGECEEEVNFGLESYCKHSPTSESMVFNS